MQNAKNLKNDLEEEELTTLPFSSEYVIDYFDEIEKRFEEQSTKKGRISQKWKDEMNTLIDDCEKLRRKYLPVTDKKRVYDRIK